MWCVGGLCCKLVVAHQQPPPPPSFVEPSPQHTCLDLTRSALHRSTHTHTHTHTTRPHLVSPPPLCAPSGWPPPAPPPVGPPCAPPPGWPSPAPPPGRPPARPPTARNSASVRRAHRPATTCHNPLARAAAAGGCGVRGGGGRMACRPAAPCWPSCGDAGLLQLRLLEEAG